MCDSTMYVTCLIYMCNTTGSGSVIVSHQSCYHQQLIHFKLRQVSVCVFVVVRVCVYLHVCVRVRACPATYLHQVSTIVCLRVLAMQMFACLYMVARILLWVCLGAFLGVCERERVCNYICTCVSEIKSATVYVFCMCLLGVRGNCVCVCVCVCTCICVCWCFCVCVCVCVGVRVRACVHASVLILLCFSVSFMSNELIVLQCVAVCCIVFRCQISRAYFHLPCCFCLSMCCNVLRVLQCVAVCQNVLQRNFTRACTCVYTRVSVSSHASLCSYACLSVSCQTSSVCCSMLKCVSSSPLASLFSFALLFLSLFVLQYAAVCCRMCQCHLTLLFPLSTPLFPLTHCLRSSLQPSLSLQLVSLLSSHSSF